jgi:DNA-binding transcriptional regulator GbsR (MarR family)
MRTQSNSLSKRVVAPKKSSKLNVKPQLPNEFRPLASTVGDFIHYWGFRRIHGQIWCALYLYPNPLSGADLCRMLEVSKALVSPALTELLKFKLILHSGGDGKTKLFTANADVFSVIKHILETRERKLILQAAQSFRKLERKVGSTSEANLSSARVEKLGSMIAAAEQAIDAITLGLSADGFGSLPFTADA